MKKAIRYLTVLALCVIVLGVMLAYCPKPFVRCVSVLPKSAKVAVYCKTTNLPSINMGNGHLVECTLAELDKTLAACDGIDGVSVRYSATQSDFDDLCKRFDIQTVSCWQSGNLIAVCGYSTKILGGVNLAGQAVNIQVAFDGETLTVGYPLILDSY